MNAGWQSEPAGGPLSRYLTIYLPPIYFLKDVFINRFIDIENTFWICFPINPSICKIPKFLPHIISFFFPRVDHIKKKGNSARNRSFSKQITWKTEQSCERHNGVHFFDTSTSKSCPKILCFVDLDFEIRFAHLSTLVRSECASHRRRICHVASWLRTRPFHEPTFGPPEPQIIGKQCFAAFLPFADLSFLSSCSFF